MSNSKPSRHETQQLPDATSHALQYSACHCSSPPFCGTLVNRHEACVDGWTASSEVEVGVYPRDQRLADVQPPVGCWTAKAGYLKREGTRPSFELLSFYHRLPTDRFALPIV